MSPSARTQTKRWRKEMTRGAKRKKLTNREGSTKSAAALFALKKA